MSATRVMVTGAGGQVGVDLVDVLRGVTPAGGDSHFQPDGPVAEDEFDVLALTRHELDVTDRDAVVRALRHARPDVVVHLAAYTAVDRAETDADACFAVNEKGTAALSSAAHDVGAHLIAISTDYVFDGAKGAAYLEDDQPHPLNVYGASKWAGERACSTADSIVRTSWVMGVRGRNVLHAITSRARSGESVRFVEDQRGTVTAAADLARALVPFIRERPSGVWHVANTGAATWFDVARYAGSVLGRDDSFASAVRTADLEPRPTAARPARSDLDSSRFASRWAALPPWREAVTRLVGAIDRAAR